MPDSEVNVPETSELILSLENLIGKNGLLKMKSIFIDPTNEVNEASKSTNPLEETVNQHAGIVTIGPIKKPKSTVEKPSKRRSSIAEKSESVKKQKMMETIFKSIVKEEKTTTPSKNNYKKKTELDRLNADINNMYIRDSVLKATGKRACTLKQTYETILVNYEQMYGLKGCSVVLNRLELNMNDKPFKINKFGLKKTNAKVTVEKDLNSIKNAIEPVIAKVALAKKPKLKKKAKQIKIRSRWTRLACKKLDLKDDEWEDVEDDQDDSKSPSPNVVMEQNATETTENIENVIESAVKEVAENSGIMDPEIKQLVVAPVPISNSTDISTSPTSINIVKDTNVIPKSILYAIPFKKVFNLSYSILDCGTVYKCTCGDCKFQTLSKPNFISHINENHMKMPWDGSCEICNKKVQNDKLDKLFISSEYFHMFEEHIKHETPAPIKTGVLFKNAGNSKDKLGFVNSPTFMPKITLGKSCYSTNNKTIGGSIVGKVIPMVKIPMVYIMANQKAETKVSEPEEKDEKSSVPTPQTALKPLPIRSTIPIKAPASTSWTQTVINAPKEGAPTIIHVKPVPENMTYVVYDNKPNETLRPWLPNNPVIKNLQICKEMLSEICLVANFKCMAKTCSYFTNDEKYFRKHLKAHSQFQSEDKPNFTKCSYCPFQAVGCDSLVTHIKGTHKFDRFQCPYCFYRTVVDFNVLTHLDLFHKLKTKMVIECNLTHVKNYIVELETIKKTRANFVPPIVCVCKY